MPEKEARLICARLRDLTRVHPRMSVAYHCDRCGEQLGIFPTGQETIQHFGRENIELICPHCAQPKLTLDKLTPQHLEEIREAIPYERKSGKN